MKREMGPLDNADSVPNGQDSYIPAELLDRGLYYFHDALYPPQ